MQAIPTPADLQQARQRILPHAHRTPVFTSRFINERAGASVFFKCENFQRVGAFKFRGACNAVMSLSDEEASRGVATHSSGNHAQALALAARLRKIPAYVVMPHGSPAVKRAAVEGYGAQIHFCEPTLSARETTLQSIVSQTGAHFVHPYNDARVIAGQGTAALELLEEIPNLCTITAPVGGGGLISGCALAANAHNGNSEKKVRVFGVEPEAADDARRSLLEGRIVPSGDPKTIADGLRTSLGPLTFAIAQQHVSEIVSVSEEQIISAMHFIWERMKIIIEPSSAVPVAALFAGKIKGDRIGVIVSGGNIDLTALPFARSAL